MSNESYKPNISVTPSSPYQIREGDTAVIYCVVTDANPNTGITWSWTKTGDPAVLYRRQNYTIPNIQRSQRGTYQYKPTMRVTPAGPYQIREGDTTVIYCIVTDANPNTGITWSWTKTGNPAVLYTGQNYTIPNIQRAQRGTYQCTATNSIGVSLPATVLVDIQYKPTMRVTPAGPYQIREGDTTVIYCIVTDANPNTGITWNWTKTGNPAVLYTGQIYTIPNIQRAQRGTYQCTATNSIGVSLPATVLVDVQCKPRLYNIDSQSPDKVVIEHFDSLQILVRILLYPPATSTQWIFTGRNYTSKVIPNNTDGYRITNTKGEIEQNITLNKSRINEKDFGEYIIMVQNDIGTFLRIYRVDTAKFPGIQESVGNQTGVAVGSAVGIVAFITIILVLVICLRRLYTFTCIIKLERKNIDKGVKRTDLTKDESSIPMAEHTVHLHGERGVYEELTETDNGNQYEGLSNKDPQETKR
ncbi:brother of CDO-like [Ostrea edulis]|uniref:brother of CDO-like n=1 Tax=Ostrea edulis TaxID=37623 RepID=UPI0024AFFEC9|nr:brother of CDO-like [Ostrea edulis]